MIIEEGGPRSRGFYILVGIVRGRPGIRVGIVHSSTGPGIEGIDPAGIYARSFVVFIKAFDIYTVYL